MSDLFESCSYLVSKFVKYRIRELIIWPIAQPVSQTVRQVVSIVNVSVNGKKKELKVIHKLRSV